MSPSFSRRAALAAGAAMAAALAAPVLAQTPTRLPPVQAQAAPAVSLAEPGAPDLTVSGERLARRRTGGDDAVSLLLGEPGVAVQAGGGTTALPVVRGMADDRMLVTVDGAEVTAFCPNHMNPPGGYLTAASVESIALSSTLSPVSAGGDNIGGVVAITRRAPVFAGRGEGVHHEGEAALAWRSASQGGSASVRGSVAGERVSLGLETSWARGENYRSGYGRDVRSSEYETYDAAVVAALRTDQGLVTLRAGRQFTPYQGFPNQRMDMTENRSGFADLRYEGGYAWGDVTARASWRDVRHEMNFLADKGGDMPMLTHGVDLGLALAATLPIGPDNTLGLGLDVRRTDLEDWWPAVAGSMMMGPNPYININGGERDRTAVWAEWTSRPTAAWTLLAGLRLERVITDAGDVQPYSWTGMMNAADAAAALAFNARDHRRSDDVADVTLRASWAPSDQASLEFGYARKTRVPNLYERYAWGLGAMSSAMTSLAGDANSWVGDIDLKPETADNLAATLRLTDGPQARRSLTVSLFRSAVADYVDADKLADLAGGFVRLRFANHDALIQGLEVSGQTALWSLNDGPSAVLTGQVSWVQGENRDTGDDLYHMAPLTSRFSLEQPLGSWTVIAELELVAEKDRVNALRHEPGTDGYSLVNLRAVWRPTERFRVDLAVENAFDEAYDLPLGGVSYGDYKVGGQVPPLLPLAGPGRSVNVGLNVRF
ncbi:MAG: TonB-dependent receptor [Caulobacter sp.]|nr:TonB-dependent receptor [Caulobacter sp.]